MKLHRFFLPAIVVLAVVTVLPKLCAAQPAVRLPQGVRAVWDLRKAYRETTPTRERVCINGLWRWQPEDSKTDKVPTGGWGYLKVPGTWPETSGGYMWRDTQAHYPHPKWRDKNLRQVDMAWYQREFTVPRAWAGRRIAVYIEYLNSYAAVFVNGRKMGEAYFPWGEVDITSACRPGQKHMLSLYVVALPLNKEVVSYAQTNFAQRVKGRVARRGLCGDVFLVSTPAQTRIGDVKVDTSVRKWEISFDTAVSGLKGGRTCSLQARIMDKGRVVKEFKSRRFGSADLKNGRIAFSSAWKPDKLWDVHTPQNMYEVQVSLLDSGGRALDTYQAVRFGFREFWIDGRDFRLNGTRFFVFAIPLDNAQIGPVMCCYDGARESMLRLKKVGINTTYTHNYGCQPGVHMGFEDMLKAADDVGLLISLSQPHAGSYDWKAPDADDTNGYVKHAEFYVRMAQNHPSVAMYSMNHNMTGYSQDMNPDFLDGKHDNMGRVAVRTDSRAKLAERTEAIIKRFDQTRVIYNHSSGTLGQMHTSNCYMNFVPIQERSDWFEYWAAEGVMPVFLCEYGVPLGMSWTLHRGWETGKLGKGRRYFTNGTLKYQFCTAEWGSQFLGDESYKLTEEEKKDLRFEAKKWRAGAPWKRWDYPFRIHQAPLGVPNLADVQAMYITDNWRAFRTWGLSAFNVWGFSNLWKLRDGVDTNRKNFAVDWDSLQKPGFSRDFIERRFERMDTAFDVSDWIPTNTGKAFLRNNQPLLAYIAGKPERFTSKDHNFHPGETVEKQIVIINNSRETAVCDCTWSLGLPKAAGGRKRVNVETGEQGRIPLRFALPATLKPGTYELTMSVRFGSGETQNDTFAVHVMPRAPSVRPRARARIALFDPKGETGKLLNGLGVRCRAVTADTDLSEYDVLIVGKAALTVDGPAPDIGRVRDGLKVLVFEQKTDVLEKRFGFRVQEYGLRRVFKRVPDHPALAGLDTHNLRDWRGEATIVPPRLEYEFTQWNPPVIEWCGLKVTRPWRCGCRGNVATVLIEKPVRGDFLPIVDGGFNLQYSPLMEFRDGSGMVMFCQMDVTGRTETDPAAARLVGNLLGYVSTYTPQPRRTALYAGDPAGRTHLEQAGVSLGTFGGGKLTPDQVLVVGPGGGRQLAARKDAIATWLGRGGRLLAVGLDEREANTFLPFSVRMKQAEHICAFFEPAGIASPLAGIGPAEVQIRDPRQVPLVSGGATVVGNGVLATAANGSVVFCQLAPWEFDYKKLYNLKMTFRRTSFLVTRLLGNMGVGGTTPLVSRFASTVGGGIPKQDILDALWLEKGETECVLPLQWKGLPLGENKTPPARWETPGFDDGKWRTIRVPGTWEDQFKDLADMNGLFLYRVEFDLPADMATENVTLVLGAIDDEDWTYINGRQVGSVTTRTNPRDYWSAIRRYPIPAGVLKAGENVLAVRVNDIRQAGGIKGLQTEHQERRLATVGTAGGALLKNGNFSVDTDGNGLADHWSAGRNITCTRERLGAGGERFGQSVTWSGDGKEKASVMIAQHGMPMKKGQWYRISLRARAERMQGTSVTLTVQNTKTWSSFFEYQRFAPTEQWKPYTFKVTSKDTAESQTKFQIWYEGTGTLWLSDVRFEPCEPAWQGRWLSGFYLDKPVEMDDPYRFFRW